MEHGRIRDQRRHEHALCGTYKNRGHLKRLLLALLILVALIAGSTAVRSILLPPAARAQVITFCASNVVCTVSGAWTFSSQIVSTVATGTAPLSAASISVVTNLNSQLHNGLTAPGSAIVGVSDTQSLTNKTLTRATSGNTVTLLCSSGPAAAIVGNSSAQTFFSCTIPANAVANLKGLRVTAVWSHSTGSATVTYGMTLNGVACWPSNNTAATVGGLSQIANFIETGSTTGNVMTQQGFFSFTATSLTGLAWTSGQTLAATFNVANTDQVTPLFFLVELTQ